MRYGTFTVIILCIVALVLAGVPALAAEDAAHGVPEEIIADYPEPDVTQIYANEALLYDRVYRRVNGAVDIFDGPNGNHVSRLDEGFNFVTVHRSQDGWVEIGHNMWVRGETLSDNVIPSSFAGVFLPDEPLPYTMAWLLVHVYPSKFPGGEPSHDNPRLLRYTKINIYDEVELEGWRWYQIGVDQWIHQTQVAKILPEEERPEGVETERWVSIDMYEQVLIAYDGETPVFATLVSTGLPGYDTREGLFHVYVRHSRARMAGLHGRPEFYHLQEVPWIMYFDDAIGLHGVYWHDGFGYRRSRGCVNMSITDAHWLFRWAGEVYTGEEEEEFAVYVHSSGEYQ
jgi:hypothetical protein